MLRSRNIAQITVAFLLVWAAYWVALPWIDCLRAFPAAVAINDSLRFCTFGAPAIPGFVPTHGWNLLGGALYVAAAAWFYVRRP
jgi:hypothetical protein